VPVGLTKHHKYGHRPHTKAEAIEVLKRIEAWQAEFRQTLGVRFVYATDEWYLVAGRSVPPKRAYDGLALQENGLGMVRDFLDEWKRVKRTELEASPLSELSILASRFREAILVTGTLFAPILEKAAREFTEITGFQLHVAPVKNERLGETITVASLLCGEDVIQQLTGVQGDLIILPRIMFDHPNGIALDDVSPADIARALHKPVALADWMGDVVDALVGRNKLVFTPHSTTTEPQIVRKGGWAVEKYL
jgi:NifB/MoaA-like Fe-S oxidoreductase